MPNKRIVYDKGNPNAEPPQPAREILMWELSAREAVANDPRRYTMGKPSGWGGKPLPKAQRPASRPSPLPAEDEAAA